MKLTKDQISTIKKRMKNNRRFRRRVEWYQMGQRRCHCCGVQMTWSPSNDARDATVEHMVPGSKGGTLHSENILITCHGCNKARGNKDWIDFIQSNNFPKSEWLIEKYLKAVEYYRENNKKVHISIFQNVRAYENRMKKEMQKAA